MRRYLSISNNSFIHQLNIQIRVRMFHRSDSGSFRIIREKWKWKIEGILSCPCSDKSNQLSCPLHICPALPCSMLSYHKVSCFQIYTDLKSLGVIAKTIQLGLRQDSDRIVDLQSDSEAKAEREKEDEVDGVICTDRYSKLLKTFWDGLKHRYNSLVSNLLFGICDAMSRLPLCLPSLKLQKFLLNPICLLLVSWTAMRSRTYRIRKDERENR